MLTADLVRVQFRKREVVLSFIDPDDTEHRNIAQTFIRMFQEYQGSRQQDLEEVLKSVYTASPNHLFYRGLIKLLQDRCEFAVPENLDPEKIREVLFLEAAKHRWQETFSRKKILEQVAQQLNLTLETLEEGLYADLREQQKLLRFETLDPHSLLQRYNIALVQAVLFRAIQLKISLPSISPARKRQLFRYIKFCQLLYTIQETSPNLEIVLDGPMSLFHSCQKYGVQMALFFPILLHNSEWKLEANLLWGKEKTAKTLFLTHQSSPWISHYPDTGQYVPPEILEFKNRFNTKYPDWIAEISDKVLELEPRAIAVPDFQLTHRPSGTVFYLEIFGYWRKASLLTRLEQIKRSLGNTLLLAVQKSFQLDEEAFQCEQIYFFRTALIPKEVYQILQSRLLSA